MTKNIQQWGEGRVMQWMPLGNAFSFLEETKPHPVCPNKLYMVRELNVRTRSYKCAKNNNKEIWFCFAFNPGKNQRKMFKSMIIQTHKKICSINSIKWNSIRSIILKCIVSFILIDIFLNLLTHVRHNLHSCFFPPYPL